MSQWTALCRSSQFSFKPAKQPATESLQAHWVVTGACQHRAVPCWCASSIESYFKQSVWTWSLGASLFVWIRWFSPWPLPQKRHSCMLPLALIKKSLVFAFKLKFPYWFLWVPSGPTLISRSFVGALSSGIALVAPRPTSASSGPFQVFKPTMPRWNPWFSEWLTYGFCNFSW